MGSSRLPPLKPNREPLPQPTIRKVDHGANTGQLVVQVRAVPKALSYELRYGASLSGGTPSNTWTIQLVTRVKPATSVTGLTPGTIYAFQVRAMGRLAYTDCSDSATRMCT